jgi:hypothetical protein
VCLNCATRVNELITPSPRALCIDHLELASYYDVRIGYY